MGNLGSTESQCGEREPAASNRRRHLYLLGMMLAVFTLFRLIYLHADPSGPFGCTDEGLHNNDARQIVVNGTPFYDTYNPSVLMPLFTVFKVPFLAVIGVNQFGIRVPSVLCCMAAAGLLGLMLWKRGEYMAAHLVVFYLGVSYFYWCQSRLGIHEPVLMFFVTLAFYLLDKAFRSGRMADYVGAFLCAFGAVLVKTSGVFAAAAFGCCLLHRALVDRASVNWRAVAVASGVVIAGAGVLTAFWFWPHRVELAEFYTREVAAKQTPYLFASLIRQVGIMVSLAPGLLLFAAVGTVGMAGRLLSNPRRYDTLDLILYPWLFCAMVPLVYPSTWFWRWQMWTFLPLVVIAIREFTRWACAARELAVLQRWVPRVAVGVFLVAVPLYDLGEYQRYFRTMRFYVWNFSKQAEQVFGTNVVSGGNIENLSCNSAKLNFVGAYHHSGLENCDEVRRAYPESRMTPKYFALYLGSDSNRFDEVIQRWYSGCPEWKRRFKVLVFVPRGDPPGSYDAWLKRED